ncbi:hypothetical protein [Lachnotalea glycerini]|uniref:hypothetical protein n=1 Tax=Lachnotalea glycerini TaxID=1763509 RepID=UPI000D76F60F|nr:hypothetical protein [Lachnotalea glycerini]
MSLRNSIRRGKAVKSLMSEGLKADADLSALFFHRNDLIVVTYKSFDSYEIKTQCARMQEENVTA